MTERRAPLTPDRAAASADILEDVAAAGHPYAAPLATRKLGELLVEVGAVMRHPIGDPDLERMLRHEHELEAARWTADEEAAS